MAVRLTVCALSAMKTMPLHYTGMTFTFGDQATVDEDDQAAVYAELILASVCDSYEKTAAPLTLSLDLKADI